MTTQIRVPFRISSAGYVDTSRDSGEQLSYSVLSAIATRIGERCMRGEYGSAVPEHLFDGLTVSFGNSPEQVIEQEVALAIAVYLPTIRIVDVHVQQAPGSPSEYHVSIRYTVDTDSVDRTTTVTVASDLLTGS